jgi:uncharacterized alkaline shock family protein YloU
MSILADLFNKGHHNKGISLEIAEDDVRIGVTIIVRYGINIPDIAVLVQESIRAAIEEMTGLTVSEVNVNVGDIYSEKAER